jgi:hypothetical protein
MGVQVINIFTIGRAIEITAASFNVTREALNGKDDTEPLRSIRGMTMLVARHATGKSYAQIGRALGGRDHSTIWKAIHRAREKCGLSPWFRERATQLILQAIFEVHPKPIELYDIRGLPSAYPSDINGQPMLPWNIADFSTPNDEQSQSATVIQPQEGAMSSVERIEA